jgi:hypothetical protein
VIDRSVFRYKFPEVVCQKALDLNKNELARQSCKRDNEIYIPHLPVARPAHPFHAIRASNPQTDHIMISSTPPPIPSSPSPSRCQTNPYNSASHLSYPALWPDLPTTTPHLQPIYQPSSPTQSLSQSQLSRKFRVQATTTQNTCPQPPASISHLARPVDETPFTPKGSSQHHPCTKNSPGWSAFMPPTTGAADMVIVREAASCVKMRVRVMTTYRTLVRSGKGSS